jgi:hypothetical protein
LGVNIALVDRFLYWQRSECDYSEFLIPKKDGGTRKITAPCPELKLLQSKIAELLCRLVSQANLEASDTDMPDGLRSPDQGIFPSIFQTARKHVNSFYVFNCDIGDFYGSISKTKLALALMQWEISPFSAAAASMIADLACHHECLPQGSPCSPILAHIAVQRLDARLSFLANAHGCNYSRYVDDITFSSKRKCFPVEIAYADQNKEIGWHAGATLSNILASEGFILNPKKSRMHTRGGRQEVTGLTVNQKVSTPRHYRHTARAMAHKLFKTGTYDMHLQSLIPHESSTSTSNLRIIEGVFSYIHSIDSHSGAGENSSRNKLYQKLLIYKHFYRARESRLVTSTHLRYQPVGGKTEPWNVRIGGESKALSTLNDITLSFARFTPSRHVSDVLGINSRLIDVGLLLDMIVSAYREFACVLQSKASHLFVFDSYKLYDLWSESRESVSSNSGFGGLDKGLIKGTNLYISYFI